MHIFLLQAVWEPSDYYIVKCRRKAWVRRVNEPTFSIIPVGVFFLLFFSFSLYGLKKLITCDKYTSDWMSCHFCQTACEEKHFCTAVILDLPNQRSAHKCVSTRTKETLVKPLLLSARQLHDGTLKKKKKNPAKFSSADTNVTLFPL